MDACIPQLTELVKPEDQYKVRDIGLTKNIGILKDREGYPDYLHSSGLRVELKLLYVDPENVKMKKPTTPRESSARLTEKVTVKNVNREKDVLLVVAYQLRTDKTNEKLYVPTILDFVVLPVADCIDARDNRLLKKGGKWFGNYEVPAVLSKAGRKKKKAGVKPDEQQYGRKESEGFDFNADTNFGKLARIPYAPLAAFIGKYGITSSGNPQSGNSPDGAETKIAAATSAALKVDKNLQ